MITKISREIGNTQSGFKMSEEKNIALFYKNEKILEEELRHKANSKIIITIRALLIIENNLKIYLEIKKQQYTL